MLSDASIGMEVTVRFENDDEDYKAEGLILEMEDGTATAVFDDDSDYDVDLNASVYDKEDHLLGEGVIVSRHPYLVEAYYGRADDFRVSVGDWVDNGSTLLTRTEVAYNADYLGLLSDREEKDVLTVPVDAIQTKDEQKVVTVLSGDDLSVSEDRVVTLGLVNNTTAQITEGLEEGETVLVIGTTQLEEMLNLMRGSRRSSRGGGGS